ncbi:hypothetical protein AKJ16_DCAP17922 [Drosera capensis]
MDDLSSGISISCGVNGGCEVEGLQAESDNEPPIRGESDSDLKDNIARNVNVNSNIATAGSLRKGLSKCATFPEPCFVSSKSEGGNDKTPVSEPPENSSYSRSVSLPVPSKLVSAMKGSREKQGVPRRKLCVSWAPNVYDPPPSISSHTVKKKNQHQPKNSKKHNKEKQKGKSTRSGGSAPKYKKHHGKAGGRTEWWYDPFTVCDSLVPSNLKTSSENADFVPTGADDISESSCASSCMKKSRSSVHFAYAEAV